MSLSKLLMVNGQVSDAAPADLYQPNVAVLMNMDSYPFTDAKGKAVVSEVVSLGPPLYGGEGSASFNGTGYMLVTDPSTIIHDAATFEITFSKAAPGAMGLLSSLKPTGATQYWAAVVYDNAIYFKFVWNGRMCSYRADHTFVPGVRYTVSFSLTFGDYGKCWIAINGVQKSISRSGDQAYIYGTWFAQTHTFYIGSEHNKWYHFNGLIDAVRVTYGVARYQTDYVIDYNQPYSLE